MSKIIEKILYNRIYDFVGDRLCPNQFGFRPNLSTQDLLCYTLEAIARNLNSMSNAIPLFFDLGKAFDTLKHDLLLAKLERLGIRGIPLNLMKSYLSNRKQKVSVNGIESDFLPLEIGVPQGSILGPLLFVLYVNDIMTAAPTELIALYADDTTCITGAKTIPENIILAKTALNNLGNWFAANGLSLSPSKCKFAMVNEKLVTPKTATTLSIYNKNLSEVRAGTDSTNNPLVGYLLTENLNSKEHINMVISKIRSGIFALKKKQESPIRGRQIHLLRHSTQPPCLCRYHSRMFTRQPPSTNPQTPKNSPKDSRQSKLQRTHSANMQETQNHVCQRHT